MSLAPTYTVDEVAASLRCSAWFVRDRVKKGTVRPLRLGDNARAPMRFTEDDVATLRAAMTPSAPVARKRRRVA